MLLSELIEALQEQQEALGEDAEVRLMTQPHYSWIWSIAGVNTSEELDEDDFLTENGDPVVYILEGQQLGSGCRAA